MARDPSRRYATVRELIDDVHRYLADAPVAAYRDRLGDRFARWTRRHRATVVASVVSLGVVACVAVAALLVTTRALDRARVASAAAAQSSKLEREANERNETTLQIEGINSTIRHLSVHDYELAERSIELVPPSRRGWAWLRLRHQVDLAPQIVGNLAGTVDQHDWSIIASLLSADGETLATAGLDGRVIVWDTGVGSNSDLGLTRW